MNKTIEQALYEHTIITGGCRNEKYTNNLIKIVRVLEILKKSKGGEIKVVDENGNIVSNINIQFNIKTQEEYNLLKDILDYGE